MIARLLCLCLVAMIQNAVALPARAQPSPGFVGREGTSFTLNGKPFYVVGVNNHYLTFGSDAEVRRVLDDAVALGANVVRTFIQPVIGSPDGQMPTVWNWKSDADASNLGVAGRYMVFWDTKEKRMAVNEQANGFQRLDFVIAEARKRGLRVLIAFIDFWGYTGGAQQMAAWYGGSDKYTFFAADPRTRQDYKTLVHYVLNRRNSLTGAVYRDDPTIFGWNLANEPDIHPADVMRDWIAEMAAYVKSLDRNHLVSSGHSSMVSRMSELSVPEIDFGTWHGYPFHSGLPNQAFLSLVGDYCAIGKEHGKPVLFEEFGVKGADPSQAATYRSWLTALHDNRDCGGWLVWRLVGRQDSGRYPFDHDGFDIHNDGGPSWAVLRQAAAAPRAQASRQPIDLFPKQGLTQGTGQ